MGAFDRLKKNLESQRESGCDTTPETKKFVKSYEEKIDTDKRLLKDRQKRERQDR